MTSETPKKPQPIDAEGFDRLARTVFRPVYPVIAGQILRQTGITQGPCLDAGCAGGYLGLAMMARSDVGVHFLDVSKEMLSLARRNAAEQGCSHRATFVHGDVTGIPLRTTPSVWPFPGDRSFSGRTFPKHFRKSTGS